MSLLNALKRFFKPNRININDRQVTVNVKCPKCNKVYFYKMSADYKGRSKPCPQCKYQDMHK